MKYLFTPFHVVCCYVSSSLRYGKFTWLAAIDDLMTQDIVALGAKLLRTPLMVFLSHKYNVYWDPESNMLPEKPQDSFFVNFLSIVC